MSNIAHPAPAARTWPVPLRWARKFLPDYFTDAPCRFHVELLHVLAQRDKRLVARVAPRGHAKSTCAALAYPLWCICEQRRRNIVIVTHESSLARQFVRDIRQELEGDERILVAYGDLCAAGSTRAAPVQEGGPRARRPKRHWSATLFTTTTGITVQAKGTGAGFRGLRVGPHRPDLVICDDLEKDQHVASPEQRQKLEHWLRRVVMPALAPDGQLLVLGSLIHYDALLANLRDPQRFPGWDYAVHRAIEAEPGPDGQYQRVALWPARWPLEKLDLERERIGTLAFEQEYQANPIDDALRVFRPEWLHRYDPHELVPEHLVNLLAVDPATGVSGGDFFALWVGSVDTTTGAIYTRRLSLERIGVVDQVKRVLAAFEEWRPVKIGVETVGYQVALKQMLEDESRRRGLYMPIVPLQTTANKRARIEGSAPFYENGTFRLPAVLDPEVERQFLHFPKARHDDAPDVCAMGIELARALRATRIEGATAGRNPFTHRGGW
jgi:predicted phage terminase large subunit-like protein